MAGSSVESGTPDFSQISVAVAEGVGASEFLLETTCEIDDTALGSATDAAVRQSTSPAGIIVPAFPRRSPPRILRTKIETDSVVEAAGRGVALEHEPLRDRPQFTEPLGKKCV